MVPRRRGLQNLPPEICFCENGVVRLPISQTRNLTYTLRNATISIQPFKKKKSKDHFIKRRRKIQEGMGDYANIKPKNKEQNKVN